MSFFQKILTLDNKDEWKEILNEFPYKFQDIYFDPDYIALNCVEKKNSTVCAFVFRDNNKIWLNSFIKIQTPIYSHEIRKKFYDLETPYGFGGPISNTDNKIFLNIANNKFLEWIKIL